MSKVALLGTEYHSIKVKDILEANTSHRVSIENLNKNIIQYLKFLFKYEYFFIIFPTSSYKFIFFLLFPLFLLRKKVYIEWIGSDVLALKAHNSKFKGKLFSLFSQNLCECTWIKEELKVLNVKAEIGPFITFSALFGGANTITNKNDKQLNLITYSPKGKEDLYSLNDVLNVTKDMKNVSLNVVAHDGEGLVHNENVIFHGWVDSNKLACLYENSDAFIRMTKHDGLSYSVLEAMDKGLQVIFTYDYPFTKKANDEMSLRAILLEMAKYKDKGGNLINHEGMNFIKQEFIDGKPSEKKLIALFESSC